MPMTIIKTETGLKQLLKHIRLVSEFNPEIPIALDFETTAFQPHNGVVRLTSVNEGTHTYIVDHFHAGAFEDVADDIASAAPHYYVFNQKFEGSWFDEYCVHRKVNVRDVAVLRQSVMGGGPLSLKLMAKWDLGIDMDKTEQSSDWSAPVLTEGQYYYAGLDSKITNQLAVKWIDKMEPHHWVGFHIINDSWRAVKEMDDAGMLLDVEHHTKLVKMWEKRRDAAEKTFRKYIPVHHLPNIRSKPGLSKVFKKIFSDEIIEAWPQTGKTKQLQTARQQLHEMSVFVPYPATRMMAALQVFNRADFFINAFGEKLINCQMLAGRVYPTFNMARAITGRFSSSGAVNIQGTPKNALVRRSFIAGEGHALVIADYSGIELRVLAELSDDDLLRHDVIFGNAHAESAIAMFGLDRERFYKALEEKDPIAKYKRNLAKVLSFRLTYGAGIPAIAASLRCSIAQADEYVRAWAFKYSRAYNFRQESLDNLTITGFLQTKSGRTIFLPKKERSLPVASNYPVQGSAADVMYAALTVLHERLEKANLPIMILASVHDEIIMRVEKGCEAVAMQILKASMEGGWLKVFPDTWVDNLIESGCGPSWASKA